MVVAPNIDVIVTNYDTMHICIILTATPIMNVVVVV